MRDAWSHLVGKCSETPPSNIETRTHQVDGRGERKQASERASERERERERARANAAYTRNGCTRNPARVSASYLCKRQFSAVSQSRSLIFPVFCEHITQYSGDIFAQVTSLSLSLSLSPSLFLSLTSLTSLAHPLRPASAAFLSPDNDTRQANATDVPSYGASRRIMISLFSFLVFLLFSYYQLCTRPFVLLRGGTAADIARVKPLHRGDSFTLREIISTDSALLFTIYGTFGDILLLSLSYIYNVSFSFLKQ